LAHKVVPKKFSGADTVSYRTDFGSTWTYFEGTFFLLGYVSAGEPSFLLGKREIGMSLSSVAGTDQQVTTDRSRRSETILSVGADPVLLSYREQVLKWAGWPVITISPEQLLPPDSSGDGATSESSGPGRPLSPRLPLPDLHSEPAMCIVCHTLSPTDRERVVDTVRARWPETRLLAISAGYIGRAEAARFDCVIENLDGPAALIRTVRECLHSA
jgi:hypothetical protein